MAAKLIKGDKLAAIVLEDTKKVVDNLKKKGIHPTLAVILVGKHTASEIYVEKKKIAAEALGITFDLFRFADNVKQGEIEALVTALNYKVGINGILIQLPLPKHFKTMNLLDMVSPLKDVDGFTAFNLGLLDHGKEEIASCTAKAILKLIESTKVKIEGANVCIVNHSIVVGRPLAQMLLNRNATVSICHAFTKDLASFTKQADIIVSAVGKPGLITKEMVKPGAIVIDAGISKKDGKTVGDVDFAGVKEVAGQITPVPGGVGPMTVACLMQNISKLSAVQAK